MSRIKHQASFKINQPADMLFPLFSAEGEKYWVPGWDYENIMGTTELHEDYVFLTAGHQRSEHHGHAQPGHHPHSPSDHPPPKTIWLVKKFEPGNYHVQFYRVEPEDKVGIVTVQCNPMSANLTEVKVAYEYIGLSSKGDQFIAGYTAEAHAEFIAHWDKLLKHYFVSHQES